MSMTEAEWRDGCHALSAQQSALDHSVFVTVRQSLAELDAHMRAAPWGTRGAYVKIPEADLTARTQSRLVAIQNGEIAWAAGLIKTNDLLLALAVQIRCLDQLLHLLNHRGNRPPASPKIEWLSASGTAYVIPGTRPRDMGSADGNKLPYGRRGTLFHRVIPVQAGGIPVTVVPLQNLSRPSSALEMKIGAAIFDSLTVTAKDSGTGFLVDKVEHADLPATIKAQAAELFEADILVWPELTINDDSLEALSGHLAELVLEREIGPSIVVAGTWHRKFGTNYRNCAPILHGGGGRCTDYSKFIPFANEEGKFEDIETGEELLVLVSDRFLATVAICKDYCDLGEHAPWPELDVDFVLVPSMGHDTTMDGHLTRAKDDSTKHGLRAFVVQQGVLRKDGDPSGYVLPALRKVPVSSADTHVSSEWNLYPL